METEVIVDSKSHTVQHYGYMGVIDTDKAFIIIDEEEHRKCQECKEFKKTVDSFGTWGSGYKWTCTGCVDVAKEKKDKLKKQEREVNNIIKDFSPIDSVEQGAKLKEKVLSEIGDLDTLGKVLGHYDRVFVFFTEKEINKAKKDYLKEQKKELKKVEDTNLDEMVYTDLNNLKYKVEDRPSKYMSISTKDKKVDGWIELADDEIKDLKKGYSAWRLKAQDAEIGAWEREIARDIKDKEFRNGMSKREMLRSAGELKGIREDLSDLIIHAKKERVFVKGAKDLFHQIKINRGKYFDHVQEADDKILSWVSRNHKRLVNVVNNKLELFGTSINELVAKKEFLSKASNVEKHLNSRGSDTYEYKRLTYIGDMYNLKNDDISDKKKRYRDRAIERVSNVLNNLPEPTSLEIAKSNYMVFQKAGGIVENNWGYRFDINNFNQHLYAYKRMQEERFEEIQEKNILFLRMIGVSEGAINRLKEAGSLGLEDLSNVDYDVNSVFKTIAKDEDSSTGARLKADGIASKGKTNRISSIIRNAKGTDESIMDMIRAYYMNIGKFSVRTAHPRHKNPYKFLLLWDKDGKRIYHTKTRG